MSTKFPRPVRCCGTSRTDHGSVKGTALLRVGGVRIATWNVNSLRSRIDRVEALLQRHDLGV